MQHHLLHCPWPTTQSDDPIQPHIFAVGVDGGEVGGGGGGGGEAGAWQGMLRLDAQLLERAGTGQLKALMELV